MSRLTDTYSWHLVIHKSITHKQQWKHVYARVRRRGPTHALNIFSGYWIIQTHPSDAHVSNFIKQQVLNGDYLVQWCSMELYHLIIGNWLETFIQHSRHTAHVATALYVFGSFDLSKPLFLNSMNQSSPTFGWNEENNGISQFWISIIHPF